MFTKFEIYCIINRKIKQKDMILTFSSVIKNGS